MLLFKLCRPMGRQAIRNSLTFAAFLLVSRQVTAGLQSIENIRNNQSVDKPFKSNQDASIPAEPLVDPAAVEYLQKYNYMNSTKQLGGTISPKVFADSMKRFQDSMGLNQTGILDAESLKMMAMPRCGNVESPVRLSKAARKKIPRRRKRFVSIEGRQNVTLFTYKVSEYPKKFDTKRGEVDTQIKRAFGVWSEVAAIDFLPKSGDVVDFDIEFSKSNPNTAQPFSKDIKVHIEDRENFTIDSNGLGLDILQTVVHELGHALGLEHSRNPDSVMSPVFKQRANFTLHQEDISAIQELYGKRV